MCRVSAHLRQPVVGDRGLQELGGGVEGARLGWRVPGEGPGDGRHPMARLITVAGGQAAGGRCHRERRDVRELVLAEVVEPALQGLIAAVPYV